MIQTSKVKLGGIIFEVPPLPHRINRKAYPLYQKLHNGGFVDRWVDHEGPVVEFEPSAEEEGQLVEFAFLIASAADSNLTREAFDDLPISPIELYNAPILGRPATGVWVLLDSTEASDPSGEAQATGGPPT